MDTATIKTTLTRKVGGVPTYVYLGAGVVVLAWFLIRRKNRKAAAAAAGEANGEPTSSSNAATTVPNVPAGGVGQMSGLPYGYGPVYENYNPPQQPTTSLPAGPDPNTWNGIPLTPISGEKVLGGGYTDPVGYFWKPIVTTQGVFQYTDNLNPKSLIINTLKSAGAALFAQTSPGVFTPVDPTKIPAGTPLYQQLPGVPYSPTTVMNPASTAAVAGSPTAAATK